MEYKPQSFAGQYKNIKYEGVYDQDEDLYYGTASIEGWPIEVTCRSYNDIHACFKEEIDRMLCKVESEKIKRKKLADEKNAEHKENLQYKNALDGLMKKIKR